MQVDYDDGDKEQLRIGLHIPVKVDLAAGEQLPMAPPAVLMQLVQVLLQEAEQDDKAAADRATSCSRRRELQREGE